MGVPLGDGTFSALCFCNQPKKVIIPPAVNKITPPIKSTNPNISLHQLSLFIKLSSFPEIFQSAIF